MTTERRSGQPTEGQQTFGGGLNAPDPKPPQGERDNASSPAAPVASEGLVVDDVVERIRTWNDPRRPAPGSGIFGISVLPLAHRRSIDQSTEG